MISPLFTTIVLGSCFIWLFMKFTSKGIKDPTEEFLEKDRLANNTRKQSLDSLEYISVNSSDFPVSQYTYDEQVKELTDRINSLSSKKIVNLTGITNTDLKMMYGIANLNDLMEFDQNFTTLCRTVFDLGNVISNLGDKQAAIACFEKGITYGTDISANYLILADLYIEAGERDKINWLIASAESIKSLTKESTIRKLNIKLREKGGVFLNTKDGSVSSTPTTSGDNILPEDILDILETVPYKSDDQTQ